jgi:hypothetical protein
VSLLLKNELRLRLGPQHCTATIRGAGFRPRPVGQASAEGPEAIELALAGLVEQGHALPQRAALWIEDEALFTMMMPADATAEQCQELARVQFSQLLGHAELNVQMSLAPCGTQWIAIALETALLSQWREALEARGIQIVQVCSALIEDMNAVRGELGAHTGHAVFVRREGASVVGVTPDTVTHIEWERCDVTDPQQFAARIEAQGLQHSGEGLDEVLPAVHVIPHSPGQRAMLEELCEQRGWTLSRALLGTAAA